MTNENAPILESVATAMPTNYVDQPMLAATLRQMWASESKSLRLFDQVQRSLKIEGRHLALPIEEYFALDSFAKCNDAWMKAAPALGAVAANSALERAGLQATDIDHLFFVTVTGVATPSVDTKVVTALGMRKDVKRTPIFGLGCTAGASGIARASDYVRAFPDEIAMLLSVELCSLTLQRTDLSAANIIASGLFGDGAAAVLIAGADRESPAKPRIVATQALLYSNTEDVLGWDIVDTGFKIRLSSKLADMVRKHIREDVDTFLAKHDLQRTEIQHWLAHAGGPNILRAMDNALALPEGALARSWNSLRQAGNLSSASVLFTLDDLWNSGDAKAGDYGMVIGMGPGFSMEMVLLKW